MAKKKMMMTGRRSKNVIDLRKHKEDQVMRAPNAIYTQHLVDEAKRVARQFPKGDKGVRDLQRLADSVMSPNHRVNLRKSKLRKGYR